MKKLWGPLFQCHVSCREIAGLIKGDGLHTWIRGESPWWSLLCPKDRVGLDPFQKMEVILTTNWDDPPSCWHFVADQGQP